MKKFLIQGSSVVLPCPSCGKSNRLSPAALEKHAQCGSCQTPLPAADEPLEVGTELFDAVVTRSQVPVLVDFWAEWCGPCLMAAPEVARAAASLSGRAVVLKVDTEAHQDLAARYGVRAIPNFVIFRGGRPIAQKAGMMPAQELTRWVDQQRV